MPDNMNIQRYYLKFILEGFKEEVVYFVTKEESERVESFFSDYSEKNSSYGFEFEDVRGRYINIRPANVILCHALWDAGMGQDEEPANYDLVLYIKGINEPQFYGDVDETELFAIASVLQIACDDQFVSFVDEDGERVHVRAERIMLMESIQYGALTEEEKAEYAVMAEGGNKKKGRAWAQ